MSDNYQAVYDAVRSKISGCDAGDAIQSAIRDMNLSFYADQCREIFRQVMSEYERPSTIYKPRLFIDGNEWCALLGENIQDGVAGFGKSPSESMYAFDKAWWGKIPQPTLSENREP